MHFKNTQKRYGAVAQLFHWAIFILFLYQFITAEAMMAMTDVAKYTFFESGKWTLYGLHKSVGLVILFLVFARISWRMMNPTPKEEMPSFLKIGAIFGHLGLYATMLLMPLSGYVMSMGGGHGITFFDVWKVPDLIGKNEAWEELAHSIHVWVSIAIYILVGLHVLAALYHYYIRRDDVLTRMLPIRKK